MSEIRNPKGHWKTFLGKDFISAEDIPEGKDTTLTIKLAGRTDAVDVRESKKQGKAVTNEVLAISFEETDLYFSPNVTNCKAIQKVAGSGDVSRWRGVKITLYRDKTKIYNSQTRSMEEVDCIRVRGGESTIVMPEGK